MSQDGDAPLLALRGVGVQLGGRAVVAPLDLAFGKGRMVMLVGPNGAGKTSLIRAILGLVPATGRVELEEQALGGLSRRERARRLAYLPQGHAAHWPLTVRDIVALGRIPHGAGDPARLDDAGRQAVAAAMARTGVTHLADRTVTQLSGGERARVALARVLAVMAPVLLVDEPTAALDPHYQIAIMEALKAETGCGALVVAVTHDLGMAARLADQVVLLDEGRLIASGPPAEVLTPERLAQVYRVRAYAASHEGRPVIVPWALQ